MLLSVAPQLAATVYKFLTPEQIREINTQMTGMVYLEDSQRIDIISKHMGIDLADLQARDDLLTIVLAALEAYIRSDPEKAAHSFEVLLDNWPRGGGRPGSKVLSGSAEAAVLFMSLPPELSAQLFQEMEPESIQAITLEITHLPSIDQPTRSRIIRRFLEIESEDVPHDSLKMFLASVVSDDPSGCADRLAQIWPEL